MNNTRKNTLIILDWDDTIFPSSWLKKNMTKFNTDNVNFKELDKIILKLSNVLNDLGYVVIITNANLEWIEFSGQFIPQSYEFMSNKFEIISARTKYEMVGSDMFLWKKLAFMDVFQNLESKTNIQNIISVGDAEYEFKATLDLVAKFKLSKKFFKTIRLQTTPHIEIIMDELDVLTDDFDRIVNEKRNLDLLFECSSK